MPEGRMLKKRISDSKKLGGLKSDSARLLYTWLIPWLDVEGRYTADPDLIKGHIFPKIKSFTPQKIKTHLKELHDIGLIILYENDGETYLQLKKFHAEQKINREREAETKIPAPPRDSRLDHDHSGLNPENSDTNKVKEKEIKESKVKRNIKEIIAYLNEKTGKAFKETSDGTIKNINGRISEGFIIEDFKKVIDNKTNEWLGDPKFEKFLRPETLFCKTHFESYLNENSTLKPKAEKWIPPEKQPWEDE